MKNRLKPMSRVEWWANLIGLTIRDLLLAAIASMVALRYIPDRTVAVNLAFLIPIVYLAIWTWIVVALVRHRRRSRAGTS